MSGARALYWDASALVALILDESNSPAASRAKTTANRHLAWDWIQIEAFSALKRRNADPEHHRDLWTFLDNTEYLSLDSGNYASVLKLLEKHRLRAADAGHLFCLKQACKLAGNLEFVCFDAELARAAKAEGIRVFG